MSMLLDKAWKKAVVAFSVGLAIIGLVFGIAALVHSRTRPNNHQEAVYGVWRVRLAGDGWDQGNRRIIASRVMEELSRLGPTVKVVESGEDVPVYIDDGIQSGNRADCFAGVYYPSRGYVKLVPVCMTSSIEFESTLMHEVGHSMGMQHVCRRDREVSDCSSVGYGVSFMNPGLDYVGTDTETSTSSLERGELDRVSSVPMTEVTGLDVEEFKRVRAFRDVQASPETSVEVVPPTTVMDASRTPDASVDGVFSR